MRERGEKRKKRSVDRIIYQLVLASYSSVCFQRFLQGSYDGVGSWIFLPFAAFCGLDTPKELTQKYFKKGMGFTEIKSLKLEFHMNYLSSSAFATLELKSLRLEFLC